MKRVGEIGMVKQIAEQAVKKPVPTITRADRYTAAKQADQLVDIALSDSEPERGYLARALFHTLLPHSDQKAREWVRQNGNLSLYIQAGPRTGLPYGSYPRLIFAWMVTEAVRTRTPVLHLGDSLSVFMRALGLLPTGGRWGTITQLKEQMQRLFSARLAIYRDDVQGRGEKADMLDVAQKWELWWHPHDPEQAALWGSKVELGQSFFNEVVNHPFPIDMRILRAVKRSPLGIDLYTTLTYRVSYMKNATAISWEQLHKQIGADYSGDHGLNEFTKAAKRELRKLKVAWPQLQYATPRGRLMLYPSEPSVSKTIEA